MADPIYLVQGDTGPQIKVTLTRQDTGSAEDITGATVKLHFRKKDRDAVLFSLTGTNTEDEATDGIAIFIFQNGQLDLPAGDYQGEVEVVFNSGTRETVYEIIDFELRRDFA